MKMLNIDAKLTMASLRNVSCYKNKFSIAIASRAGTNIRFTWLFNQLRTYMNIPRVFGCTNNH